MAGDKVFGQVWVWGTVIAGIRLNGDFRRDVEFSLEYADGAGANTLDVNRWKVGRILFRGFNRNWVNFQNDFGVSTKRAWVRATRYRWRCFGWVREVTRPRPSARDGEYIAKMRAWVLSGNARQII